MSWLVTLIASVSEKLLQDLYNEIDAYFKKKAAEKAAQAAADTSAQESVAPLQSATTGQEVSNAASSALDGV